jgi:DNA-directed RNA polymerase specialized sigma24 family protein
MTACPPKPDRRLDRRPLTPEQRELVAACYGAPWVAPWTRRCVFAWLVREVGWDDVLSEAWVLIVKAARRWVPGRGTEFESFAKGAIRRFLHKRLTDGRRNRRAWAEMPVAPDTGAGLDQSAPCGRGVERDDLLAGWCHDAPLRGALSWRERVVLYLRAVEGWTLEEVGAALGIARQRVDQIVTAAREKLLRARGR